jgi:hypothetical protein
MISGEFNYLTIPNQSIRGTTRYTDPWIDTDLCDTCFHVLKNIEAGPGAESHRASTPCGHKEGKSTPSPLGR